MGLNLKLALYAFISAVVITLSEFIFVGVVVSIMNINMEQYNEIFLVSISGNVGLALIDFCMTLENFYKSFGVPEYVGDGEILDIYHYFCHC